MIVPMPTGRSITPVYIPTYTTTNTTQTYENSGSTPSEQISNPWAWVFLIGVGIIILIPTCMLIRELKKLTKGDEK